MTENLEKRLKEITPILVSEFNGYHSEIGQRMLETSKEYDESIDCSLGLALGVKIGFQLGFQDPVRGFASDESKYIENLSTLNIAITPDVTHQFSYDSSYYDSMYLGVFQGILYALQLINKDINLLWSPNLENKFAIERLASGEAFLDAYNLGPIDMTFIDVDVDIPPTPKNSSEYWDLPLAS